jgi:hypothetical protein
LTLLWLASSTAGAQGGGGIALESMLARAGTYVTRFTAQFANVVAEERYLQNASGRQTISGGTGRGGGSATTTGQQRRELVSDFLLVKLAGVDTWVPFRDVFEVDGRPVREREERLAKLLLHPTDKALEQAQQILEESARYNIGDVQRTVNMPLLGLIFLDPVQQRRFTFSLGKEDPGIGPGIWIVNYQERASPSFVHTPDGRQLFASGRMWIDAETGRVAKTEVVFQDASRLRASVTTSFRADDRFHVDVPVEMIEDYTLSNRSHVSGRAAYGRFRRFDVSSSEVIPLPDPEK